MFTNIVEQKKFRFKWLDYIISILYSNTPIFFVLHRTWLTYNIYISLLCRKLECRNSIFYTKQNKNMLYKVCRFKTLKCMQKEVAHINWDGVIIYQFEAGRNGFPTGISVFTIPVLYIGWKFILRSPPHFVGACLPHSGQVLIFPPHWEAYM